MPDFLDLLTSASPASHLWFLFSGIVLVGIIVALIWLAEDEPKKAEPDPRIALALNDIAEGIWELARLAKPEPAPEPAGAAPDPVKPLFDKYPTPEEIEKRQARYAKTSTRVNSRSGKKAKR